MVADLSLPVEIVGCDVVRENDGLALSSRNVRLSADEREAAVVLHRALVAGQAAVSGGLRSGQAVKSIMHDVVAREPRVRLDYAVAVDASSLAEVDLIEDPSSVRLLIAAQVGPVRLIDNAAAFSDVTASGAAFDVYDNSRWRGRRLERIG
jgi:pantoate--beta-alanine ligase